mgnify:CR=1 FL=1
MSGVAISVASSTSLRIQSRVKASTSTKSINSMVVPGNIRSSRSNFRCGSGAYESLLTDLTVRPKQERDGQQRSSALGTTCEYQKILVCSKRMYEVIADFGERVELDQTARVDTRYKTVDRKVRPVVTPLPEVSEVRMKGVASDRSLWDPAGIGHRFTDITLRELKVGGGGFLLPAEEERFRRMLGRHGKALHSRRRRSGA